MNWYCCLSSIRNLRFCQRRWTSSGTLGMPLAHVDLLHARVHRTEQPATTAANAGENTTMTVTHTFLQDTLHRTEQLATTTADTGKKQQLLIHSYKIPHTPQNSPLRLHPTLEKNNNNSYSYIPTRYPTQHRIFHCARSQPWSKTTILFVTQHFIMYFVKCLSRMQFIFLSNSINFCITNTNFF